MDLEIIILSEAKDRERQISYGITHMWDLILKNDTNDVIYKTEKDSPILKTNLWLPKGKRRTGRDKLGVWD